MKNSPANLRYFSASVEISDLENLGWEFDIDQDDTITREQWYAVVCVDGEGHTTYHLQQLRQYGNNTSDGGWTGDDEKTINELVALREEGKLWDIDEEYQLR